MSSLEMHVVTLPSRVSDHTCIELQLGDIQSIDSDDLARDFIKAAQWFNDSYRTTVWVDVVAQVLPLALLHAVAKLGGFGLGLVLTHEATLQCSHAPGYLLPQELRGAVAAVSRPGLVWHPYAQALVPSRQFA